MEKTKTIKYQDREYIQVLLPVKPAILLRKKWTKQNGEIDELKMYDAVLTNMFDKEYTLDDFVSVHEVDTICIQAITNQYGEMK